MNKTPTSPKGDTPGESEAEKLRKQLAQAQIAIEHKDARIAYVVRQREAANMVRG